MKRRRLTREYPSHWSLNQASLFMAETKMKFGIPKSAAFKSKYIRRHQVIRVTWKWVQEVKK